MAKIITTRTIMMPSGNIVAVPVSSVEIDLPGYGKDDEITTIFMNTCGKVEVIKITKKALTDGNNN